MAHTIFFVTKFVWLKTWNMKNQYHNISKHWQLPINNFSLSAKLLGSTMIWLLTLQSRNHLKLFMVSEVVRKTFFFFFFGSTGFGSKYQTVGNIWLLNALVCHKPDRKFYYNYYLSLIQFYVFHIHTNYLHHNSEK